MRLRKEYGLRNMKRRKRIGGGGWECVWKKGPLARPPPLPQKSQIE
jgi:hypothetical protein